MSFPTIHPKPYTPVRFGRAQQTGPGNYEVWEERIKREPRPIDYGQMWDSRVKDLQTPLEDLQAPPQKVNVPPPLKVNAQGTIEHTGQNVVEVYTERFPAKVGGLGEVALTVPQAKARLMPKKDIRIIVPYLTPHAEADAKAKNASEKFQQTGVTLKLTCHDGKTRDFEILQKFEPVPGVDKRDMETIGNMVYAIRNDELFRAKVTVNGVEQDAGLQKYTYNPKAGEYEKVMMFNRAAATLIPLLDGNNTQVRDSKLKQFGDKNGKNVDVVMAHDWLSGPVLHELPDDPKMRKIFMLHNKYDKIQIPKVSKQTGLYTPDDLYDNEQLYSPLQVGIESADAVIGERNFVKSLLETPVGAGLQFVDALREKYEMGLQDPAHPALYNMHHGLSADFTPLKEGAAPALSQNKKIWVENSLKGLENKLKTQNKSAQDIETAKANFLKSVEKIQDFQFQPMKSTSLEDIKAFKAANKEALQKKLGLNVNTNATIIGWAARLEPRQKGFYLVQYCMEKLLAEDKEKKLQFVVYGDTSDKAMQQWIKKMLHDYPGQIYMPNQFGGKDDILQLAAGGDYTALCSIYEPYGLTQLEAMKIANIPVVHGVDGLRSSIADSKEGILAAYGIDLDNPQQVAALKKSGEWERVWGWQSDQQNGFLMAPLNLQAYQDYIDRRQECEEAADAINQVDSPDTGAQKLTYDQRVTNLTQKLKDSIGGRKGRLSNLKKELPLGFNPTQVPEKTEPESQKMLDALNTTKAANVLSYAQMAKRRLGYEPTLTNAEVMIVLNPAIKQAIAHRSRLLKAVEHEKLFTAQQDKAKHAELDVKSEALSRTIKTIEQWQQEIETTKSLMPESQQAVQAFFSQAVQDEQAEIRKKHAMIQKARALNHEITQLTKLKNDVESTGRLSPTTKQRLLQIFTLSEADRNVNEVESGKLLDAMQRALNTAPERLLQIRQNGMKFVDTEHNWDKIVAERYRPVMEDETVLSRRKERNLPPVGATQTKTPIRKIMVQKPNIPASPAPTQPAPTGFFAPLLALWSSFWAMQYKLLSFLTRPLSFKMD